jgi:hypothetical protein
MPETPTQDPLLYSFQTVRLKHADAKAKQDRAIQASEELRFHLEAHIDLLREAFELEEVMNPPIAKRRGRRPTHGIGEVLPGIHITPEQVEFMMAIDRYKRRYRRPHPTFVEILAIAHSLGYRKVAPPQPSATMKRRA